MTNMTAFTMRMNVERTDITTLYSVMLSCRQQGRTYPMHLVPNLRLAPHKRYFELAAIVICIAIQDFVGRTVEAIV